MASSTPPGSSRSVRSKIMTTTRSKSFLTNAMGQLWLMRSVLPLLQASEGFVVQLSAVAAEQPLPGMAVYCGDESSAERRGHGARPRAPSRQGPGHRREAAAHADRTRDAAHPREQSGSARWSGSRGGRRAHRARHRGWGDLDPLDGVLACGHGSRRLRSGRVRGVDAGPRLSRAGRLCGDDEPVERLTYLTGRSTPRSCKRCFPLGSVSTPATERRGSD